MTRARESMLVLAEGFSALVVDEDGEPTSVLLSSDPDDEDFGCGASLIASLMVALREHPDELQDFLEALPAVAAMASDSAPERQSN